MVSFTTAIKNGFKKAFDFSGRATRAEYWWWTLFELLVTAVLVILGSIVEKLFFGELNGNNVVFILGPYFIWCLIILIPCLSLKFRRLHDSGYSGWYLLWYLVPYIGAIPIFLATIGSSEHDNKYGPNPQNNVNTIVKTSNI